MLLPNAPFGYTTPSAGLYCAGFAERSIFTASNVSCPVPCSTASLLSSYIASNAFDTAEGCGPRPPTEKSCRLATDTAGTLPCSVLGNSDPSATALNGEGCPLIAST